MLMLIYCATYVFQAGHTHLNAPQLAAELYKSPTLRGSCARAWIREYFSTQADYAPVGATTMHIPPRKMREVWEKYVSSCSQDQFVNHLGERQFARVFERMLSSPFVCPFTHREMKVKIRTQRARGFKICKTCEDHRLLLWTCKNREKKKVYQHRLRQHWDEHEDGRDVYHDHKNYCASSGGKAISLAVDAADQSKFGVFKTSHRGIQDAYLKVKQKITGALVHGLGYFLFRSVTLAALSLSG